MAVFTSSLCSGLDNFSVADTSLFVAKISFVMADITIKVTVIPPSVAKIRFVVAELTFKVAVITYSMVKIIFVVVWIIVKVAVITSSLANITL